ncbi:MerR family transcriptional regulator [Streptomyces qinzhouensis]|uniref:MerR family transcriptional regulator n=1 Tax=Streptomyces qinzhouensis TaxID=2599401 RepID=A0A5B8JG33_9ACTN|nr:MerR family transcriptional regulator [Streptomyces qinzhouensis]QDY76413.1 MerR family transcriptional regulator [Streptomyces qinzhouensis]
MFTIGDFARHGRVSARMLRHYDAIGLLRPEHTDPRTGYRHYAAAQLAVLNRIVALKDLGFTLDQVRRILDDRVGTEELRGMLLLRRAELEAAMAAAAGRLDGVEARLRSIENEGRMPVDDVVLKSVPAVRVAELTATARSYGPEDIGPVIGPLYDELFRRLAAAGVSPAGPGIAYYESESGGGSEGGDGAVLVHASVTVAADARPGPDIAVVVLPALERAATIVHRGSMDTVVPTSQTLARWIDAHGHRSAGYAREVTLECPPDREKWVTELQEPLLRQPVRA